MTNELEEIFEHNGHFYRLDPDYQPPVKRWVFNPEALVVDWTHDKTIRHGWIEVKAEYAAYLQAKPDGEMELREVDQGDMFFNFLTDQWDFAATGIIKPTPGVLAFRWCKPRKVAAVSGRYEVRTTDGIKYVWDNKGRYAVCSGAQMQDMYRIAKAMNAIEAQKKAAK